MRNYYCIDLFRYYTHLVRDLNLKWVSALRCEFAGDACARVRGLDGKWRGPRFGRIEPYTQIRMAQTFRFLRGVICPWYGWGCTGNPKDQ